tara:strand:- start:2133 stop:2300 length:168 start_codon:yes stop_codon:yes gene_type:complete
MKESDISVKAESYSDLITTEAKIFCDKCGGSGNLKTPENSRRTCLSCYGKGYKII